MSLFENEQGYQFERMAKMLAEFRDALEDQGFTETESFELTKTWMENILQQG